MDMSKISEILISKYIKGDTTLEEEKIVKNYFSSKHISKEHESMKVYFDYLSGIDKKEISINVDNIIEQHKLKTTSYKIKTWLPYAASILLFIGIYSIIKYKKANDYEYSEADLIIAENAILYLSKKTSEGQKFIKIKEKKN